MAFPSCSSCSRSPGRSSNGSSPAIRSHPRCRLGPSACCSGASLQRSRWCSCCSPPGCSDTRRVCTTTPALASARLGCWCRLLGCARCLPARPAPPMVHKRLLTQGECSAGWWSGRLQRLVSLTSRRSRSRSLCCSRCSSLRRHRRTASARACASSTRGCSAHSLPSRRRSRSAPSRPSCRSARSTILDSTKIQMHCHGGAAARNARAPNRRLILPSSRVSKRPRLSCRSISGRCQQRRSRARAVAPGRCSTSSMPTSTAPSKRSATTTLAHTAPGRLGTVSSAMVGAPPQFRPTCRLTSRRTARLSQ